MFTALMIIGIIVIAGAVFGLAFRLTGAVLMAFFWMLKLPLVLVIWALGLAWFWIFCRLKSIMTPE